MCGDPKQPDKKLKEMHDLGERLLRGDNAERILICGDFNSDPHTSVFLLRSAVMSI